MQHDVAAPWSSFDPGISRPYLLSLLPPVLRPTLADTESVFNGEFSERVRLGFDDTPVHRPIPPQIIEWQLEVTARLKSHPERASVHYHLRLLFSDLCSLNIQLLASYRDTYRDKM